MVESVTESVAGGMTHMQQKYKVVFLGDQSVGKTSIIIRYTQDSFDVKYSVSLLRTFIAKKSSQREISKELSILRNEKKRKRRDLLTFLNCNHKQRRFALN